MKRNLILLLLLFTCMMHAQLYINNTAKTPAQLVQSVLVGSGVTATNIRFNNSAAGATTVSNQAGEFSTNLNGSNINLSGGVILTTGKATYGLGPNTFHDDINTCQQISSTAFGNDPDLAMASGQTVSSSAILEFDFIATGLELNFDFVFASEEYAGYVNSINDVFGFFLRGPGVYGPYSGNAKNIAIVPNTTIPISINTINNGPNNNGNCVNCQYYVNNGPTGQNPYNPSVETVEYDGFTKVLRASSPLQCGGLYHIKLAVGNVSDDYLDSAVFLKNFTIPPLQLLDDSLYDAPNVCFGKTITINSGLTIGSNRVEWYKDNVLLPTQLGPSLLVDSAGVYTFKMYTPSGCLIASDDMTVTYSPEIVITNPVDFNICTSVAPYDFDDINQTSAVLHNLNPMDYVVTYYNTNASNEAVNGSSSGIIPDADLADYHTTATSTRIWMRIEEALSSGSTPCAVVRPFDLNVIPPPSGTISYDPSYCNSSNNNTPKPVTGHALTSGGTYSATPPGLIINSTTGAITPFGSTVGTYTVKYEIPASTTCAFFTTNTQVEIESCACVVQASVTIPQVVCVNDPLPAMSYTTAIGVASASIINGTLPNGVTGNLAGGIYTLSGIPNTPGVYNFSVALDSGNDICTSNVTINVIAPATIALNTSSSSSTNQTLCIDTVLLTNIEYSITGGSGASVTGLPNGVTGSYSGGLYTISGIPTESGVFNYTVTATGGCTAPTLSGRITVNPKATIALTSAGATTTQELCINTPLTDNIVYLISNGGTGVIASNLPPGVTGIYSAGTYTISGTPNTAGVYNYTVDTTGGCSSASLGGTITVKPNVILSLSSGIASTNQSLCINDPLPISIVYNLSNVDATGAIVTGLPNGITSSYASGVLTISGIALQSGSFSYMVVTSGGCSSASQGGLITVAPEVTMSLTSVATSTNQTLCINTPLVDNIVYQISNGGTGAGVTGLPNGLTGSYGAGDIFTISGTPTEAGFFSYTVTTTGGCSSAILTGTVTVNPDATMVLSSGPTSINQDLCINFGIAPITYDITNADAIGAVVSGLPPGVTGTYTSGQFKLAGIANTAGLFNYSITTSGGCSSVSLTGRINVNPEGTITLIAGGGTNQDLCINTSIVPIRYQITDATGATITGLPNGVTGTFGAGGVFTISGASVESGVFNYILTTSGGCSTASLGSITVNPLVTLNLSSAVSSTNQNICINTAIADIQYALGNVNATGATVSGLPPGVTTSYSGGIFTISGIPNLAGTFDYIIKTAGGCGTSSLNGRIVVNPNAVITLDTPTTSTQEVCINNAILPIRYSLSSGALNASITSGGLPTGVTAILSAGVLTISGNALSAGTYNYQISTSGGCGVATLSGMIRVNPNVSLTLSSAPATAFQDACIGESIDQIKYNVQNGATGAIVTGLPNGITYAYSGGVLIITGSSSTVNTFPYVVTTVGGCGTATLNGSITINPNVTIALSSAPATTSQVLCIGNQITDITYLLGSGATGASLVSGTVPVGISGSYNATNKTFTISGTASQSGVFNYMISTTGGCGVATLTGSIKVDPLPKVHLQQDGFICVDLAGNPISTYRLETGLSAGVYSFEWSTASTGVISGASGPSYDAPTPGVYSVKVTNTATGCYDTAQALIVPSLPPSQLSTSVTSYFEDNQMVTISASPAGNYEYQLDNGPFQTSNYFVNLYSGEHTITVKDKYGCGFATAKIWIVNFPKFFTPNNDGYNDVWNISEISGQSDSKIYIFDRFGRLLKEIMPSGDGWDGTIEGKALPSTDYWFIIYYKENNISKEFKSHFSLKR